MSPRERQHRMGAIGECICPKCETRIEHQRGVRCQEERCPACGAKMLRVGSDDYELWVSKRQTRPTP
jgi:Zn finger protein HypA/HybF involved in hydrogenase expression